MFAVHIGFATSHTVQDMINNAFINKQTSIEVSSEGRVLVQNDWVALERDVTLRLFKPSDYFSSSVSWEIFLWTTYCHCNFRIHL